MKKFSVIILIPLITCLHTSKANREIKKLTLKVIEISEYEDCFNLKTFSEKEMDTIFVVSWKKKYFEKLGINKLDSLNTKIEINKKFNFTIVDIGYRVGHYQDSGVHVIVGNDTIISAMKMNELPKYYRSLNSEGLDLVDETVRE